MTLLEAIESAREWQAEHVRLCEVAETTDKQDDWDNYDHHDWDAGRVLDDIVAAWEAMQSATWMVNLGCIPPVCAVVVASSAEEAMTLGHAAIEGATGRPVRSDRMTVEAAPLPHVFEAW